MRCQRRNSSRVPIIAIAAAGLIAAGVASAQEPADVDAPALELPGVGIDLTDAARIDFTDAIKIDLSNAVSTHSPSNVAEDSTGASGDISAEPASVTQESSADTVGSASLVLVLPIVNGSQGDVTVLLRDGEGRYYVDADTLANWRMARPYPAPIDHEGRQFYALDDFPGIVASVAERTLTATVTVPPELMTGTRRSLSDASGSAPADGAFGTFVDYDLAYTDDESSGSGVLAGLLSPTVFTRRGSLSASMLYQSSERYFAEPAPETSGPWIRLDTAWTRDDPGRMRTLRIGDAITPYGSWGRSVRFGGIQFATNFATRPHEITFPQPSINGTAAVPSALDILVNGTLRSRTDVPSGAFQIDNIPVVTGAGQIQVVTRDLLGREQVVTQDFYVSERLLRRGLKEYSLNAGAVRENFGYASNSYGDFLLAGMLRRGLSDVMTIESRFDATSEAQSAGASVARAIGRYGVTSAALAVSAADQSGLLLQVGHEFNGRVYRGNLRLQTSHDFTQPGLEAFSNWPERQIIASGGRNFGARGSLGITYIDERFVERADDRQIFTLSYSRSLTRRLMLSASASHIDADDGGGAMSVIVNRVLGPRSSVSSSLDARRDSTLMRVDHRYEPPLGPGFGYRTSLVGGDQQAVDGAVALNTEHARYAAEVSKRESVSAWRLQTRGSLALLGGELFAAREISDGFAVVDAAGFEGVRVYLENREIGTTNRNGHLLVPSLRPYEGNQVRIETSDLPLSARVGADSLRIAPYYRSGAIASFDIKGGASAILRVILPDGTPVPEGARAYLDHDVRHPSPVGIDGRLYVEGVHPLGLVQITYGAERCAFSLPAIPSAPVIPDLGDLVCRPTAAPAPREERTP